MFASFNSFEIQMTKAQAITGSHSGSCDSDIADLLTDKKIQKQLEVIGHEKIKAELKEYGAWSEAELNNWEDCKARIVWLAAGNICEEV